jgi:sensor histidine kinase YesM
MTGTGHEENKVGLRNVNERIKLIYGRKYGVSIECSKQEAYVRVVLTFP